MVNPSKKKGYNLERMIRDLLNFELKEQVASRDGRPYFPDVVLNLSNCFYYLECKWRKNGWKSLYEMIEKGAHGVVLKADYKEPLFVIPLDWFVQLLRASFKRKRKVSNFIKCLSCGEDIWDNPYNWIPCPFCGVFSDRRRHKGNGTESREGN